MQSQKYLSSKFFAQISESMAPLAYPRKFVHEIFNLRQNILAIFEVLSP